MSRQTRPSNTFSACSRWTIPWSPSSTTAGPCGSGARTSFPSDHVRRPTAGPRVHAGAGHPHTRTPKRGRRHRGLADEYFIGSGDIHAPLGAPPSVGAGATPAGSAAAVESDEEREEDRQLLTHDSGANGADSRRIPLAPVGADALDAPAVFSAPPPAGLVHLPPVDRDRELASVGQVLRRLHSRIYDDDDDGSVRGAQRDVKVPRRAKGGTRRTGRKCGGGDAVRRKTDPAACPRPNGPRDGPPGGAGAHEAQRLSRRGPVIQWRVPSQRSTHLVRSAGTP